MAITASVLIRTSLQDLGVLGAGEAARGEDMADGLRRLRVMLAGWSIEPLTVVQTRREVFATTAGKGTYTIGPGLDLNTERPPGQQSVVGAGLLLNAGQPNQTEIPRAVLTYDMYEANQVKTLTNSLFTSVFYRPGVVPLAGAPPPVPPPAPWLGGTDLGQIILWPIPLVANPLVLYLEKTVPLFQDLTTSYAVPDGHEAAIQHNLTVAMAAMYQVEPSPHVVRAAALSFAAMKRNNYQFTDVALDPMFTMQSGGAAYNIDTGGLQRRG